MTVIVITYWDKQENRRFIDYGVDAYTDKIVILPQIPIDWDTDLKYDADIGEYYYE